MIKGTPSKRPATPIPPPARAQTAQTQPAAQAGAPRTNTIMGMPSVHMPAGPQKPLGVTSMQSAQRSPAAAQQVSSRVAAAVPAAAADAARSAGLDPSGPEMQALMQLSREVIERVVWEVVPDLAETIIRENIDRLAQK